MGLVADQEQQPGVLQVRLGIALAGVGDGGHHLHTLSLQLRQQQGQVDSGKGRQAKDGPHGRSQHLGIVKVDGALAEPHPVHPGPVAGTQDGAQIARVLQPVQGQPETGGPLKQA